MMAFFNLFRLWLKELFSSLSFILSETVLMVSITILTFSLVFSESMIEGTDKIISLLGGEYNIFVDHNDKEKVKSILDESDVLYKESKVDIALIKNENTSFVRFVKVVDNDYFTKEMCKRINVSLPLNNGLYLSNVDKLDDKYALFFSSQRRGTIVPSSGTFETGLKTFDENTAFFVLEKGDSRFNNLKSCFEMIENDDNTLKTISSILESGIGVSVISKKDVNESFYSSLSPTRRTIEFIAFLFVLLSSFYSISLIASFNDNFGKDIKFLYLLGCSKRTTNIISIVSVFISMIFFILVGFLCGILLSYLFPPLISVIANLFGLDLNFYFLSFDIKVPFLKLITRYLIILFALFLISLPMFIKRKKSI